MENRRITPIPKANNIQAEKPEPSEKGWLSRHPLVSGLLLAGGLALVDLSARNTASKEAESKSVPTEKRDAGVGAESKTERAAEKAEAISKFKLFLKYSGRFGAEYKRLQKEEKISKYQELEADFQDEVKTLSKGELIKLLNEGWVSIEAIKKQRLALKI